MEKCLIMLISVFQFFYNPAILNYTFQFSAIFVFGSYADLQEK